MNIYLTSGTMDFMESVRKRYLKENMVVMHGSRNSVLLHETKGITVFQTPRRYEVISTSGTITEKGFFALNNIPVTDEGRPIFEHRFKSRADTVDTEPGFVALRLLRPLDSDTYVVLTQWTDASFFKLWKNSSNYKHAHADNTGDTGLGKTPHIFSSAPYVTTYKTKKEENTKKRDS